MLLRLPLRACAFSKDYSQVLPSSLDLCNDLPVAAQVNAFDSRFFDREVECGSVQSVDMVYS